MTMRAWFDRLPSSLKVIIGALGVVAIFGISILNVVVTRATLEAIARLF